MSSITKHGSKYRAQLCVKGIRDSKLLSTKREAELWAAMRTLELQEQVSGKAGKRKTLRDALNRFADEVSPTHKGHRWECIRLHALAQDKRLHPEKLIGSITTAQLNEWKTARLKEVSSATVLREIGLLSSVLTYARRDWGWLDVNPLSDVRRPKAAEHRQRLITWVETKRMLRQLDYSPSKRPQSFKQVTAYAFLFALRTGMRQGEILGIEWVNVRNTWVNLPDTKNGTARDVPLSRKAMRLLDRLRLYEKPFQIAPATLDATFRRARKDAGLTCSPHPFQGRIPPSVEGLRVCAV